VRLLLRLRLRLLRLHPGLLAGLVLAAPAAAPMPMRLRLTVVRCWPLFRLGLSRFCCHDAYTSWYFAFWCIEMRVLPLVKPIDDSAQKPSGSLRKVKQTKPSTALLPNLRRPFSYSARKFSAHGFQTGRRALTSVFQPLSLLENAIAASSAGVVNQLHPAAGVFPAQPLLFSENALSYVSLHHAQHDRNQTA
jgi:hypothetical protein